MCDKARILRNNEHLQCIERKCLGLFEVKRHFGGDEEKEPSMTHICSWNEAPIICFMKQKEERKVNEPSYSEILNSIEEKLNEGHLNGIQYDLLVLNEETYQNKFKGVKRIMFHVGELKVIRHNSQYDKFKEKNFLVSVKMFEEQCPKEQTIFGIEYFKLLIGESIAFSNGVIKEIVF
jgi:hypothetical protein